LAFLYTQNIIPEKSIDFIQISIKYPQNKEFKNGQKEEYPDIIN